MTARASVTIGGARVFEGTRVLDNQDVVVRDGVIAVVEPATRRSADVDGRNHTLLPGLFDAHVHLGPHPEAGRGEDDEGCGHIANDSRRATETVTGRLTIG